jgi:hypothetical protein
MAKKRVGVSDTGPADPQTTVPPPINPFNSDDAQLMRDLIASCKITDQLIQSAIRAGYPCDGECAENQAQMARAQGLLDEFFPASGQ